MMANHDPGHESRGYQGKRQLIDRYVSVAIAAPARSA
jgi:hypothetical protein